MVALFALIFNVALAQPGYPPWGGPGSGQYPRGGQFQPQFPQGGQPPRQFPQGGQPGGRPMYPPPPQRPPTRPILLPSTPAMRPPPPSNWERVPKECGLQEYCKSYRSGDSSRPMGDRIVNRRLISGGLPRPPLGSSNRVTRLYDEVHQRLDKIFLKGRPESQLSSQERKVLAAMKASKLVDPLGNPECAKQCRVGGMAANLKGKLICICPAIEKFADEFIVLAIAHEIGHSGDICGFKQTGLPPGDHPYELGTEGGSVLNCLATLGVPTAPPGEVERIQERLTEIAEMRGQYGFWARLGGSDLVSEWNSIYRKHPHCYMSMGQSKMREASADLMALEVVADFLKDYPLEKKPDNFGRIFGYFVEGACVKNHPFELAETSRRGHPDDLQRIFRIGLSLPAMRESLHCSGHSANLNCEYQPPGAKPASSSPATTR